MRSMIGGIVLASGIGAVVLAGSIDLAFAKEYWVEYNYSTHHCSIVEKKSQAKEAAAKQGPATAKTTNVAAANTPSSTTTMMLPAASAPGKVAAVIVKPGATPPASSATAPGTPATKPRNSATNSATSPRPAATNSSNDNTNNPTAALAAAWARNKAAAEATGTADITTALIGTAMASRQDAESEMQIMRKCGIAP